MSDRPLAILVVDDDAHARLIMHAALRKSGYVVQQADSGESALAQFRAEPCDMVMLDVDMPGLGGYEVCAILRAEAGPLLPIVMVTGMDDVQSVETAYEHGATDFIAKPVNWALIGHRVRYLFRGHQTMLDLRAAEARNAAILNAIPDLLFELDIHGRYIDFRAPRTDLLAAPATHLIGRTVHQVLPAEAAAVCMAAIREALDQGISNGKQILLPLVQGSTWFELSVARKSAADSGPPNFIVLSRDITERKLAEAQIASMAYFDSLTGLPNRRSFLGRVDGEIRRAARRGGQLAVLFMDLDGFKNINDTMGHAAGDLILQGAATRLRDGLRPSDEISRPMSLDAELCNDIDLARLGGDEFTALILDIEHPEDAIAVADRIGLMMRRPFALEGREVTLTTSIGIALYPQDGGDSATLLKHADTAMYHAKRSGRDNSQVYSAALTQEIVHRMDLEARLRNALDRKEFHLVYQPQIDLSTQRVHSVEALIRWNHPERGQVSPTEFIPLAEQSGLIERIGLWVLQTASTDAARWQRGGHPVRVAVNLSPLQVGKVGLPQSVLAVLAAADLAPASLELEVTEGALMENSAATRAALETLHSRGVRIALDDFGTGYSSLAYLQRMPIDNIKIDRRFIGNLLDSDESRAIVRAILAMAGSLRMQVTAEGVETLAQAQALVAMGCTRMQGFYFSHPVRAEALTDLLQRPWTLDADLPRPPLSSTAAGQP